MMFVSRFLFFQVCCGLLIIGCFYPTTIIAYKFYHPQHFRSIYKPSSCSLSQSLTYLHQQTHKQTHKQPITSQQTTKLYLRPKLEVTDEQSKNNINLWTLAKFGIPTLGICLLQPILSLIDTSVVGISKHTSVAELASLGPGIAWVDSSAYLFTFLAVATTSLYASALRDHDDSRAKEVLTNAIGLALFFGCLLLFIQFYFSPYFISILSGTSIASIPYAITYSRIRALAAPAALFTIVAQAAFLARKDSITPLKAVILGSIVNVLGDIYLVTWKHLGVAGAAWATIGSQYAGAFYLIYSALQEIRQNYSETLHETWLNTNENDYDDEEEDMIHMIAWKETLQSIWKDIHRPTWEQLIPFLRFCGPLFLILLMKSFLWTYTTYATAAAGAIDLAAHQIIINFFLFFCIFGDVISQLAQTFVPYTLSSHQSLHLHHIEQQQQQEQKVLTDPRYVNQTIPLSNQTIPPIKPLKDANITPTWTRETRKVVLKLILLGAFLGLSNAIIGFLVASFGNKVCTCKYFLLTFNHLIYFLFE